MVTPRENQSSEYEGRAKQQEKRPVDSQDLTGQVLASNDSESKAIVNQQRASENGGKSAAPVDSTVMEQINNLYR